MALPSAVRATDLGKVTMPESVGVNRATEVALPKSATGTRRVALLLCGTLSLGLGLLGIVVPLLPTTCFLLLAAWCYARSSQRLYNRLLTARLIGPYLQRYRDSRVIPPKVKTAALVMMWITIGYAVFTYPNVWVRLTLLAIAIGVTIHLQKLPGPKSGAAD
ncbi:MAG TPA: YbaN family protein [Gemmatimonadaceae bacterium]|nr:YbaN family protein [Gemmatimonadaceae bacterium]